jgi:hypothetical protein
MANLPSYAAGGALLLLATAVCHRPQLITDLREGRLRDLADLNGERREVERTNRDFRAMRVRMEGRWAIGRDVARGRLSVGQGAEALAALLVAEGQRVPRDRGSDCAYVLQMVRTAEMHCGVPLEGGSERLQREAAEYLGHPFPPLPPPERSPRTCVG